MEISSPNRKNKRKRKLASCALCKPHKRGGKDRWKPKKKQELFISFNQD